MAVPLITIRPVSSTYALSAIESAICAFCSTSRIVVPARCSSWMMSKICSTRMGASPIDGSSSISRVGWLMSARPIASICCSPPERVPATCLRRSLRRGNRS